MEEGQREGGVSRSRDAGGGSEMAEERRGQEGGDVEEEGVPLFSPAQIPASCCLSASSFLPFVEQLQNKCGKDFRVVDAKTMACKTCGHNTGTIHLQSASMPDALVKTEAHLDGIYIYIYIYTCVYIHTYMYEDALGACVCVCI